MTNRASALAMAGDAAELDELANAIAVCGLMPIAARSAEAAIRLLAANDPAAVLLGWNARAAWPHARGCEDVLRAVFRRCGSTPTFVYGAGLDGDPRVKARAARVHPLAVLHDRAFPVALPERLQLALDRCVGDLNVDRGCVVHLPSGRRITGGAAMKAMIAYPHDFHVDRENAMYIAVWRLRRDLRRLGSVVTVKSAGGGFFRLVLDERDRTH